MPKADGYEQQRSEAEAIYKHCFEWCHFLQSQYNVPKTSEIEKAIACLNNIPKDKQTEDDLKQLVKYYLSAGLTNVLREHMYPKNYTKEIVDYRNQAVQIQRTIFKKNNSAAEKIQLAELLSFAAVAHSEMNDHSQALTEINEAISLINTCINYTAINQDENDKLADLFLYYHIAQEIAGKSQDYYAMYINYQAALLSFKKLDPATQLKYSLDDLEFNMTRAFKQSTAPFKLAEQLRQEKTQHEETAQTIASLQKELAELKKKFELQSTTTNQGQTTRQQKYSPKLTDGWNAPSQQQHDEVKIIKPVKLTWK